jgi:hypothetical protein
MELEIIEGTIPEISSLIKMYLPSQILQFNRNLKGLKKKQKLPTTSPKVAMSGKVRVNFTELRHCIITVFNTNLFLSKT